MDDKRDPVIWCTQFQLAFYFWQQVRNLEASAIDLDLDINSVTPNTTAFRAWWEKTTHGSHFDGSLEDLISRHGARVLQRIVNYSSSQPIVG